MCLLACPWDTDGGGGLQILRIVAYIVHMWNRQSPGEPTEGAVLVESQY
jgi:hypothetical protein